MQMLVLEQSEITFCIVTDAATWPDSVQVVPTRFIRRHEILLSRVPTVLKKSIRNKTKERPSFMRPHRQTP